MKELGENFAEKRIAIGITIEEIANDLNIDPIVIENLEAGNAKVFRDVLELKEIILQLAKYLGLDEKYVMEELNDYLFEKTSKISIDDIKEQLEKTKEQTCEKKITSPYTIEEKKKNNLSIVGIIIVLSIILIVIFYFVLRQIYIG